MGKETQIALGVIGVLVLIVALVVVTRINGLGPHPDASIDRATSDETEVGPARVERVPTIVQPRSFNGDPAGGDGAFAAPIMNDHPTSDPTRAGTLDPHRTYLPLRGATDDPTIRVQRPSLIQQEAPWGREPSYLPLSKPRAGADERFRSVDDEGQARRAQPDGPRTGRPLPDPIDPFSR